MGSQGKDFSVWYRGFPAIRSGDQAFGTRQFGVPYTRQQSEGALLFDLSHYAEMWLAIEKVADPRALAEMWILIDYQPLSLDTADEMLILLEARMVGPVETSRVQRQARYAVEWEVP